MISKNKRKRYQKTIAKFCLMDDTFMAKFFENNIEDTGQRKVFVGKTGNKNKREHQIVL